MLSLWRSIRIRHSLNGVSMLLDAHNRHSHYLANTFAQVLVTCSNHVALVLCYPLDDAVVGVGALVHAGQPLESSIFSNAQCDTIGLAQLLQLGHHTVRDVGNAFGVHAVHHRLAHV